jgi:hypothetical protein
MSAQGPAVSLCIIGIDLVHIRGCSQERRMWDISDRRNRGEAYGERAQVVTAAG